MLCVVELFTYLDPLREAGFAVDFVPRVEGIVGSYDKEETLRELEPVHRQAVEGLGFQWSQLWRAEQVHGAEVFSIATDGPGRVVPAVDGLLTKRDDVLLGIYVADCGLIWIADPVTRAMALLHSGRKGTEGEILTHAVESLKREYGSRPEDLIVVLGPCIRPPHYEVDIATQIARQARAAGIKNFHDCGICTGANVADYYSYRLEKGCTGRMLGLLGQGIPAPRGE
ncbi:hypothetical protein GCM10007100_31040 [Roseibacillus persicicus]|uniref:Laccase domain-containing protein n=1 Tax=Roseibacillus persicicus TaxID=454148 RepID=A0A918TV55_9BACT|nr:hypothetical protein GCM10007100_31040 [Roseibacillus persicicus]